MKSPKFKVGQVVRSTWHERIAGSILGIAWDEDYWIYELQNQSNGIGGYPRVFESEDDLELLK